LYVATDNEPAIGLYEKMGFKVTEEVMDVCGPGKQCYQMELFFSN
jgi:ribosomal-protein-alanine N-acetyltransferase